MSLLSHDRYQYDSLILSQTDLSISSSTLCNSCCDAFVSVRLNLPEVEERKLCPLRYYANCVHYANGFDKLHNVESVYFFYSNPVYLYWFKFKIWYVVVRLFVSIYIYRCRTYSLALFSNLSFWSAPVVKFVALPSPNTCVCVCVCVFVFVCVCVCVNKSPRRLTAFQVVSVEMCGRSRRTSPSFSVSGCCGRMQHF